MRVIKTNKIFSVCLLMVILLLGASANFVLAEESEDGISNLDEETKSEDADAVAAAAAAALKAADKEATAASAAAAKKAAEVLTAVEKTLKEEARIKAEPDAARIKAEQEAAAETPWLKELEDAEKSAGRFESIKGKISFVTDAVITKSLSIIEKANSMTGKQRKQALAFVAATGFGTAFVAGGKPFVKRT